MRGFTKLLSRREIKVSSQTLCLCAIFINVLKTVCGCLGHRCKGPLTQGLNVGFLCRWVSHQSLGLRWKPLALVIHIPRCTLTCEKRGDFWLSKVWPDIEKSHELIIDKLYSSRKEPWPPNKWESLDIMSQTLSKKYDQFRRDNLFLKHPC